MSSCTRGRTSSGSFILLTIAEIREARTGRRQSFALRSFPVPLRHVKSQRTYASRHPPGLWKRLRRPGDPARLEDVARDAGVTRQAIHLHFRTRGAMLVALVRHMDETLGLHARIEAIEKLSDPVEALVANMKLMAEYEPQIHGVAMALASLAATDAEARAAFEDRMELRRKGLVKLVRAVQRRGRLMSGFSAAQVADVLWEAGAPSSYEHLVVERGWSPRELERWLVHLARTFVRR